MLYEIINMSDPYTMEAHSLDVAAVACLLLGSGQYALDPFEEGAERVPMFMFGDPDPWFQQHFGKPLKQVIADVRTNKRAEIADCLDSVLIGKRRDRETYLAALALIDDPAKQQEWRDRWLDDRRSSLNNIGGRAYKIARNFRKPLEDEGAIPAAPQQVYSSL
jgi:hypothetical protein